MRVAYALVLLAAVVYLAGVGLWVATGAQSPGGAITVRGPQIVQD